MRRPSFGSIGTFKDIAVFSPLATGASAMASPRVVEYKGYLIEVRVERISTLFATWQIRQIGQNALVVDGAISRAFENHYDAETAAIEKAKAWLDLQAAEPVR